MLRHNYIATTGIATGARLLRIFGVSSLYFCFYRKAARSFLFFVLTTVSFVCILPPSAVVDSLLTFCSVPDAEDMGML